MILCLSTYASPPPAPPLLSPRLLPSPPLLPLCCQTHTHTHSTSFSSPHVKKNKNRATSSQKLSHITPSLPSPSLTLSLPPSLRFSDFRHFFLFFSPSLSPSLSLYYI